ncbi:MULTISPECIES: TetR/AcrR family transcriptional regulator [unclassified Gluconobacter]|uniref:TetR/AcrR family transcriptional regulator n=1 Tax=unclassified Gluconobacter TaxID=2644261 RepID=UPI0017711E35|nr:MULTISPECIES: TetR/AcrR family transcriptional regulator [unclassified Gluconobacter]GFE97968.1 TetR family transcriptional regulator [Gluconobacter sp. Gdi]
MAGRPREFDRYEALRKARDLFWSQGFESTSMADLVSALGLASARLYAAFGSKEQLFREAVEDYEAHEGGFVERILAEEASAVRAIERIFREAIALYTRPEGPKGCMVVVAATNCSAANEKISSWLADQRLHQTLTLIERMAKAKTAGEFRPDCNTEALGDAVATFIHGLSIQARDNVPVERLNQSAALMMILVEQQTLSG